MSLRGSVPTTSRRIGLLVLQGDGDAARVVHHVVIRDDVAVVVPDETGARARRAPPSPCPASQSTTTCFCVTNTAVWRRLAKDLDGVALVLVYESPRACSAPPVRPKPDGAADGALGRG